VKLLVCGVLLLSRAASAADACALVPAGKLSTYLGIAKQTPFKVPELPQKATEAKACSYGGQEYNATVILIKFDSPSAAREYLSKIREELEKKGKKTATEKFDGEDGFSLPGSMLAVKKNGVLRTNVNPPSPDLTRQVLLLALRAN
jgi:hypothetical protein